MCSSFSFQGEFSFQDHAWKTISSSAKELISRLLSVEPYKRPTASDVCPMLLFFLFHPYCHIGQSELHITVLIKVVDLVVLHHLDQLLGHPWVIGDWAKQDLMDAEVISKLKRFNARRKLRAAAIASVLSSKVALRTKRLRNLLGTHDLSSEELDNLRAHFARM